MSINKEKWLFDEFPMFSAKEWELKIINDLKKDKLDINDLKTPTVSGIDILPFYHQDQAENFTNFIVDNSQQWNSAYRIEVDNSKEANKVSLECIKEGIEVIYFHIIKDNVDLLELTANLPRKLSVYIFCNDHSMINEITFKNLNERFDKLFFIYDALGKVIEKGEWTIPKDIDFNSYIINLYKSNGFLKSIYINSARYQNSGASIIQELTYTLLQLNEYLNATYEKKNSFKNLEVVFEIAIGNNFFFEIAKIKALRLLYKILCEDYGIFSKCKIIASPSKRNKTIVENETNLVRSSMECISAIIGGADIIHNFSYDSLFMNENSFSRKINIQQLNILKEEANFKNRSPIEDSFFLKNIINDFVSRTLENFKKAEKSGGFLENFKKGIIQSEIKLSRDKEQELFNTGEISLVGVNCNVTNMASDFVVVKKNNNKNTIKKALVYCEPLLEFRLAREIEKKMGYE